MLFVWSQSVIFLKWYYNDISYDLKEKLNKQMNNYTIELWKSLQGDALLSLFQHPLLISIAVLSFGHYISCEHSSATRAGSCDLIDYYHELCAAVKSVPHSTQSLLVKFELINTYILSKIIIKIYLGLLYTKSKRLTVILLWTIIEVQNCKSFH